MNIKNETVRNGEELYVLSVYDEDEDISVPWLVGKDSKRLEEEFEKEMDEDETYYRIDKVKWVSE